MSNSTTACIHDVFNVVIHSIYRYDILKVNSCGEKQNKDALNVNKFMLALFALFKGQHVVPSMSVLQNETIVACSKACVQMSGEGLCPYTTAVCSVQISTLRFHSTPYDTHCLCSHPVNSKERISQTVPPSAPACLYLADCLPSLPLSYDYLMSTTAASLQ